MNGTVYLVPSDGGTINVPSSIIVGDNSDMDVASVVTSFEARARRAEHLQLFNFESRQFLQFRIEYDTILAPKALDMWVMNDALYFIIGTTANIDKPMLQKYNPVANIFEVVQTLSEGSNIRFKHFQVGAEHFLLRVPNSGTIITVLKWNGSAFANAQTVDVQLIALEVEIFSAGSNHYLVAVRSVARTFRWNGTTFVSTTAGDLVVNFVKAFKIGTTSYIVSSSKQDLEPVLLHQWNEAAGTWGAPQTITTGGAPGRVAVFEHSPGEYMVAIPFLGREPALYRWTGTQFSSTPFQIIDQQNETEDASFFIVDGVVHLVFSVVTGSDQTRVYRYNKGVDEFDLMTRIPFPIFTTKAATFMDEVWILAGPLNPNQATTVFKLI